MTQLPVLSIVRASPWLMARLAAARSLRLPAWCIGGGVVRTCVWDARFGRTCRTPARDIDLAWVGSGPQDGQLEAILAKTDPGCPWEVRHQPRMFGGTVDSLDAALARWPEACTAVGVWLDDGDRLHAVAPLGLNDLWEGIVRRNPACMGPSEWAARMARKQWWHAWPEARFIGVQPSLPGKSDIGDPDPRR